MKLFLLAIAILMASLKASLATEPAPDTATPVSVNSSELEARMRTLQADLTKAEGLSYRLLLIDGFRDDLLSMRPQASGATLVFIVSLLNVQLESFPRRDFFEPSRCSEYRHNLDGNGIDDSEAGRFTRSLLDQVCPNQSQ